jgi:hypothetical protein
MRSRRCLWCFILVPLILSAAFAITLTAPAAQADIVGCPLFPPDNVWNMRVDGLPAHPNSANYIAAIGGSVGVHPDFGSGEWNGAPIGIPYTTVLGTQPLVTITFHAAGYPDESDQGPFPIPPNAPIEGGPASSGDRHVLVVDRTNCKLYELYNAVPQGDGSWQVYSSAIYTLTVNGPLRTAGWTSADAAGLPILPGLARYEEVATGVISHALRFTSNNSANAYVWPARHKAPVNPSPNSPPMGLRVRLKSSFIINSGWSTQTQIILTALKQYGMILADNGSSWYISGAPHSGWDDDALVNQLRNVKGSDFEVVDISLWTNHPSFNVNSGQVVLYNFTEFLFLPLMRR